MLASRIPRRLTTGDPWRRPSRGVTALALVAALGVGGGTAQALASSPAEGVSARPAAAPRFVGPPPLRLDAKSVSLQTKPYTACWSNSHGGVCYDGIPPQPPPSLGETFYPVTLSFPRDGWSFSVSATDADGDRTKVTLIPTGDQSWRLDLSDYVAGRYRLDIFGTGPQGDVAAAAALNISGRAG